MPGVLDGKVALITGGASGIGLATAHRFRAEGASVVIAGRRKEELDRVAAEVGGDTLGVPADIAESADLDRLCTRIEEAHGHLDILFANASIVEPGGLGNLSPASIDRQITINIKGLVLSVERALPLMGDGGSIIVTSSVDGVKGGPGRSVYAASKAAARNLVRSWVLELAGRGIRVNAVSPGNTETPGLARLAGDEDPAEFFARMAALMPNGRNVRTEEVAAAVTFLASPDASGINGIDLPVDNGFAQV